MYAYKKRLNEEKNKRKMIEDAKKTELEVGIWRLIIFTFHSFDISVFNHVKPC